MRAARRVPKRDWKHVYGHDGDLGRRAAEAMAALHDGTATALPAWRRYTGVVWEHLDPSTLTKAQRRRIVVVSALLGVVGGEEPVPDHRLKLSVSLPRLGRLDRWWRPVVTEHLRGLGRGPIVDLLPKEHAAAVDWDELRRDREVLRPDLPAVTGHAGKAAKGLLARRLLVEGVGIVRDP